MSQTLLRTKVHIPPLRPNLVSRPRLVEQLNLGLQPGHKLTLVSAPAGFGKSTLLSGWVRQAELRTADLRFTIDEVSAFLKRSMGLALTAEDVAALEARTEGWIVEKA